MQKSISVYETEKTNEISRNSINRELWYADTDRVFPIRLAQRMPIRDASRRRWPFRIRRNENCPKFALVTFRRIPIAKSCNTQSVRRIIRGQSYSHHVPRSIADTDDNDRKRVGTCCHDCISRVRFIGDLAICDDHQYVKLKCKILKIPCQW